MSDVGFCVDSKDMCERRLNHLDGMGQKVAQYALTSRF